MTQVALTWHERQSDSRFIQSVWATSTSIDITRTAIADPCISITLATSNGSTRVILAGPKTKPSQIRLPGGYSCTTIRLKPGVFLRGLSTQKLINKSIVLPADAGARFWLEEMRFLFPDFEHVERLVDQLFALGCLGYQTPDGHLQANLSSPRTYARRMRRITGLSPYRFYQLQRIHEALQLLKQGRSAAEVAAELAFVDQSHLVRASRKFFGHTPKQLLRLPQNP
jgi:AraC-like DNA-binding protein